MRIITVDKQEFGVLCEKLLAEIQISGYEFDTLVAVARAGVYLAERLAGENYFTVKCEREVTAVKKGWIKGLIRRLPVWVNDNLRKLEYQVLALKDISSGYKARKVIITQELEKRLKTGGRKVLIVDDAVDSGRSLLSVKETLFRINTNNEIRTAVITVTRTAPILQPDYALYRNQTLIRFPWAADFS